MKITYLFIVLILFQSCAKKAENTLQLFDEEKILSAITVNSQLDSICYPGDLEIVDSLLFILDWQNDYYLSAYSLNSGKLLKEFGKKGRGPQELSRAISIDYNSKDHSLDCFTRAPKRVNSYSLDTLNYIATYSPTMMPKDGSCYHAKKFGSGYIGTGRFVQGMYALFEDEKVNYYGEFPKFTGSEKLSSSEKSSLLQGLLKVHPSKNKFVFVSSFNQTLDINRLENNCFEKIKRYSFDKSKYSSLGNGAAAKLSTDIYSYCDVDVTDQYIFCLYVSSTFEEYLKDRYLGDYLLIFDWNGTPIKKYKLEKPLNHIAFDDGTNSIYGLALEDEIELVKYKLDI
jgi:hypothetical protein